PQSRGYSTQAFSTTTALRGPVKEQITAADDGASVLSWSTQCGSEIYIATAKGSERPLSKQLPGGNGGLRIWDYADTDSAIAEAIGLAQGMENKHAVYNTGFAGAKVVVNTTSHENRLTIDKKALMLQLGHVLNDLDGTMYTGCDMNSDLDDMELLASQSPYVLAGIPNLAMNPNAATAHGVLGSLAALAERRFGGLQASSFVVHGLGNVGSIVARELLASGATVSVYDVDPERMAIPGTCSGGEAYPRIFVWLGKSKPAC
ncbi:ldh, partial [Symbiodinium pilosum]